MAWILTRRVLCEDPQELGRFSTLDRAKDEAQLRAGDVELDWRCKGDWHTAEGECFDVAYDAAPEGWQPPRYTGPVLG